MVVDFVDALRATLKERGWARVVNNQEEGGHFLVGVSGLLFHVEGDFQVGEARDGFDAVGCGDEAARGALFATPHLKPEARVRMALSAATPAYVGRSSCSLRGGGHTGKGRSATRQSRAWD